MTAKGRARWSSGDVRWKTVQQTSGRNTKPTLCRRQFCYALPTRHQSGNAMLHNFVKYIKSDSESLKHEVNSMVLSLWLNEYKLSASPTAESKLFRMTGSATEKAWSFLSMEQNS